MKWIVIIAAVLNYGFMFFDGSKGLIAGDYVRPATGEYAGQLGPWSELVEATGMDPESASMKTLFVIWGIAGLFVTGCFIKDLPWSRKGMMLISISSLWYLVPGTVLSLLQLAMLLFVRPEN
jgi:hypothetical protein